MPMSTAFVMRANRNGDRVSSRAYQARCRTKYSVNGISPSMNKAIDVPICSAMTAVIVPYRNSSSARGWAPTNRPTISGAMIVATSRMVCPISAPAAPVLSGVDQSGQSRQLRCDDRTR